MSEDREDDGVLHDTERKIRQERKEKSENKPKPVNYRNIERLRLKILEGGKGIETVAYKAKADKPLTPKQEKFLQAMLAGKNPSDAYRIAYDCARMKPATIHCEASKLVGNPAIAKRLKEAFKREEERVLNSGVSLRRFVQERLFEEASKAPSDSARIRALELLGKMEHVGLFKDKIAIEDDNRTEDEIKAEIAERLKAAFGE